MADGGERYPKALSAKLGFLLAQAHMAARARADRALDVVGLSMKGFATLATLISDGPTSQQRLSRRIRMDPATMVDVIDSLESGGYIVRKRNPSDRREYALQLTPRGRALYERGERAIIAAEKEIAGNLQPAEVRRLMELLERISLVQDPEG